MGHGQEMTLTVIITYLHLLRSQAATLFKKNSLFSLFPVSKDRTRSRDDIDLN